MATYSTEIRILGPLEVLYNREPIELDSPKQRALLAALVVRANEVVPSHSLVESMWPVDPPSSDLKTLRYHVSKLRTALRSAGPEVASMLVTQSPGYRLDVLPAQVDAARFEAGVKEARRIMDLAPAEAASLLADALGEWRGPALTDFELDEFAQPEIRRLDELRLVAETSRVDAELAAGAGASLVGELESLVTQHPTHERLWEHLMISLYRAGRTRDALEAYQRARAELSAAGVIPSDQLSAVEAKILADDPSLRPPESRVATGLPAPLTDLIGRDAELEHIGAVVGQRRLVTLTGPGGVGKTSVALEVAHRLVDAGKSMAWVELATASEAAQVVSRVSLAVGVREQPGRELIDVLRGRLASRSTIVVIDNCEHLLDAVGAIVADLLPNCPELTMVTTSREPLRVAGELVIPITPLAASDETDRDGGDAVVLFEARSRDANPSFELSNADRVVVANICRELDGLPLAIELAAARMSVMSPRDLAARLDDRFRFLTTTSRGGLERHDSLAATIRWSYDLLTAEQQLLLDRLAVFAGSFSLEAVERVCGFGAIDPDSVVDLLGDLVAKSLVVRRPSSTVASFGLLETIKEWAARSLRERVGGKEGMAELAARHAEHFAEVASVTPSAARDVSKFTAIEGDIDRAIEHLFDVGNLEAAAGLMASCFSRWHFLGRVRKIIERFEALLPCLEELTPASRAFVLLGAAPLVPTSSDPASLDRSSMFLNRAIKEFGAAGTCACQAYNNLGTAHMAQGRLEEAVDVFRRGIDEAIAHSCPENGGRPLINRFNLAVCLTKLGRIDAARAELEVCEAESIAAGWSDLGLADIGFAEIRRLEGDLLGARDVLRSRSDQLDASAMNASYSVAWANADLARIEVALGEVGEATIHVIRSLETFANLSSIDDVLDALVVAAAIAEQGRQWSMAAFVLGGVKAQTERIVLVLRDDSMELIDPIAALARSALSDAEFDVAWTAGAVATVAEISERAIGSLSTSESS